MIKRLLVSILFPIPVALAPLLLLNELLDWNIPNIFDLRMLNVLHQYIVIGLVLWFPPGILFWICSEVFWKYIPSLHDSWFKYSSLGMALGLMMGTIVLLEWFHRIPRQVELRLMFILPLAISCGITSAIIYKLHKNSEATHLSMGNG